MLALSLLLLSSLSSSQSSFLCDFIASTNISEIREFHGWECLDNEPVLDVCQWSHVRCSSGKVSRLDLTFRNISGLLPDSIQELRSLQHLHLDDNHLFGTLPTSLGQLTNLKSIQLSGNHLHGQIPDLSALTKLTALYLNHNSFTGTLPSSPTLLPKLLYLSLNHNNLTGAIPEDYTNLVRGSGLIALDLASNQLTGEIPMAFCQTDTIIYTFHNDDLIDRCRGECLDKGCNRQTRLHDFSEGLPPVPLPVPPLTSFPHAP